MADPFTAALGVASIVTSIFGQSKQNKAAKKAEAYQESVARANEMMSEWLYEDTLRQSDKEIQNYKKQVGSLIGTQKVSYAASGVEADTGSAFDVQAETAFQGELDILQMKQNAYRQAFGYKMDAINGSLSAANAIAASKTNREYNTLATGVSILNTIRKVI